MEALFIILLSVAIVIVWTAYVMVASWRACERYYGIENTLRKRFEGVRRWNGL